MYDGPLQRLFLWNQRQTSTTSAKIRGTSTSTKRSPIRSERGEMSGRPRCFHDLRHGKVDILPRHALHPSSYLRPPRLPPCVPLVLGRTFRPRRTLTPKKNRHKKKTRVSCSSALSTEVKSTGLAHPNSPRTKEKVASHRGNRKPSSSPFIQAVSLHLVLKRSSRGRETTGTLASECTITTVQDELWRRSKPPLDGGITGRRWQRRHAASIVRISKRCAV